MFSILMKIPDLNSNFGANFAFVSSPKKRKIGYLTAEKDKSNNNVTADQRLTWLTRMLSVSVWLLPLYVVYLQTF